LKKLLLLSVSLLPILASAQGWQWGVGSSCKEGYFESAPITVDKNGNTYEVGKYSFNFSPDSLISIFGTDTVLDSSGAGLQSIIVSADSDGIYRWVLGVQYGDASFTSIKADNYGNVYLVGSATGYFRLGAQSCSDSNFIVKINTAGNVVWIRSFTPAQFQFKALCISSGGNIYVTGEFWRKTFTLDGNVMTNTDTSGTTEDVFYAGVDTSGAVLWARSFGGTSNDGVSDIAVTNDSTIYIAGIFGSDTMRIGSDLLLASPGNPMFYVATFRDKVAAKWAKTMRAYYDSYFSLNAITADDNDNLYVTGQYGNEFFFGADTLAMPITFGNPGSMFIVKYDSSGNEKWARSLARFNTTTSGYSVATDACLVWVSAGLPFATYTDTMLLATYDTSGGIIDTIILPAGGDDANAIVTDHRGNLYIGGDYYTPFQVGNNTLTLTDNPQEALFILKYRYEPSACASEAVVPLSKTTPNYTLFPNPTDAILTVSASEKIVSVSLMNAMGQAILNDQYNATQVQVDVANFPAGVYLVRINGYEVRRFVKL